MTDATRHSFQNGALRAFIKTKRYLGPHLLLEKRGATTKYRNNRQLHKENLMWLFFLNYLQEDVENVA